MTITRLMAAALAAAFLSVPFPDRSRGAPEACRRINKTFLSNNLLDCRFLVFR